MPILYALLALGALGAVFGLVLDIADKKFAVETDERVELIRQDASSVPASRYGPLFILSPGNCEVFEVK